MKKFIVFGVVLLISVNVYAGEVVVGDSPTYIGVGAVFAKAPYTGVDTTVLPIPIVIWNEGKYYIEGIKAGYKLWNKDEMSVDVVVKPRLMGFDASDSDALSGMNDRDPSLDGGFEFKMPMPYVENFTLNTGIFFDLLSEHEGFEVDVSLSKSFKHEYFLITPNIGVKWQSEDLTDYYYGVMSSEVAAGRAQYNADSALNFYANVNYIQGLSENWVAVTRLGVEWYDEEIQDSPIVDESVSLSAVLGIARKF